MKLAIIGAGSWGTALAIALAPRFEQVSLWGHETSLIERIRQSHENDVYLPGIAIPANVHATDDLEHALWGAIPVIGVMPSRFARRLYGRMLPYVHPGMQFVSATKGLEQGTLLRMSEVLENVMSPRFQARVAVLSGPSFAKEVALGDPVAIVISSREPDLAVSIQRQFSGPTFRLYSNDDPIGVEMGAALKNVIAIGAGVCKGLGLGSNAVAALITRGLAEITRLAVAMGGEPRTLAGLAGLGDLVLTCTGDLSRNRSVGIQLAQGRTIQQIAGSMSMIAEGIETTSAALGLAERYVVEMPIAEQMAAILEGMREPRQAIRLLMERSLKNESL